MGGWTFIPETLVAAVMSLFLDFPCLLSGSAKVISAAWCVVEPICAFSTNDHCISFYLEEGVSMERCRILRKSDATAIAWHPTAKVIAAGWEDGCISAWDLSPSSSSKVVARDLADTLSSTCIFSDSNGQAPILTIMWNPSATRLVSANNSGAILIWKVKLQYYYLFNPEGMLIRRITAGGFLSLKVFPLDRGLPAPRKASAGYCRVSIGFHICYIGVYTIESGPGTILCESAVHNSVAYIDRSGQMHLHKDHRLQYFLERAGALCIT